MPRSGRLTELEPSYRISLSLAFLCLQGLSFVSTHPAPRRRRRRRHQISKANCGALPFNYLSCSIELCPLTHNILQPVVVSPARTISSSSPPPMNPSAAWSVPLVYLFHLCPLGPLFLFSSIVCPKYLVCECMHPYSSLVSLCLLVPIHHHRHPDKVECVKYVVSLSRSLLNSPEYFLCSSLYGQFRVEHSV